MATLYDHDEHIPEIYDAVETDTDDVELIRRLIGDTGPLRIRDKQPPPPEPRTAEQIVFDTIYAMSTGKNATGLAGSAIALEDLGRIPKISIAAIDGVCTAGGLELVLGCDIILVSETAQISDLHLRNLGLIGGAGSCTRLARRVGVSKAIELCCTCDVIDGKEAYRIGLANQVFAPDKLLDGAKEMAKKIAQ